MEDCKITYVTENSYSVEEVFNNIRSICVVGSSYERHSLCIFAEDYNNRIDLISFPQYGQSKYKFKAFYVPLPQWHNPMVGYVFDKTEYCRIKIEKKGAYHDKELLGEFVKASVNTTHLYETV